MMARILLILLFTALAFPTAGLCATAVGCPLPTILPANHTWYVDPVNGSMSNDGSQAHPWHTLAEVVNNGLVSSQQYKFQQPYKPGSPLIPQNPQGKVKPGDRIFLMTGDHGVVNLYSYVNSNFITVQAAPGQLPVLDGLYLRGASKWIFRGLTVQHTATSANMNLVEFVDFGNGPTTDIDFENNLVLSAPDSLVNTWNQAAWLNTSGGAAGRGILDECSAITIKNNTIRNIQFGLGLSGPNTLVEGNTIDNFGDDGIDVTESNITIKGNRITNNHLLGDGNHNDGIQGFNFPPAVAVNVVFDSNFVCVNNNPSLFANCPQGQMQGISIFDGAWNNVTVTNNVVITNIWHGIAMYGIQGCQIINNSVIGSDPTNFTTWILTLPSKTGMNPSNNVVRNNVATMMNLSTIGVKADHNVTATNTAALFTTFDNVGMNYNLSPLAPTSALIGKGNPLVAPKTDITGWPRGSSIDIGAYEVRPYSKF